MTQTVLLATAGSVVVLASVLLTILSIRITHRSRAETVPKRTTRTDPTFRAAYIGAFGTVLAAILTAAFSIYVAALHNPPNGNPTACSATIVSPQASALTQKAVQVTGVFKSCQGDTLWLTLQPGNSHAYYIVGRVNTEGNNWSASVCLQGPIGQGIYIGAVVANRTADTALAHILASSRLTVTLPAGIIGQTRVLVVNSGGKC